MNKLRILIAVLVILFQWLVVYDFISHLFYYLDIEGANAKLLEMEVTAGIKGTVLFYLGSSVILALLYWLFKIEPNPKLRFVIYILAIVSLASVLTFTFLVIHGNVVLVNR
jgi:hypothetical protein